MLLRRAASILALVATAGLFLAACSRDAGDHLVITGSSTVAPLVSVMAERFEAEGGRARAASAPLHSLDESATLQRQALDERDAQGRTPLLRAVEADDVQAVQRLLEAGANPRLADREGATPLDHARRRGNTRVIELIEAAQARMP